MICSKGEFNLLMFVVEVWLLAKLPFLDILTFGAVSVVCCFCLPFFMFLRLVDEMTESLLKDLLFKELTKWGRPYSVESA